MELLIKISILGIIRKNVATRVITRRSRLENIDRIDMIDRNIILSDWADLGLVALIQRNID
jgi:hypothetical protein